MADLRDRCACSVCGTTARELGLMDNSSVNRDIGVANTVVCRDCVTKRLNDWLDARFKES